MNAPDREEMLNALGHTVNCVSPDHYRRVWQEERDRAERAEQERDFHAKARRLAKERAERAERERDEQHQRAEHFAARCREAVAERDTMVVERDALRADNERLREALQAATDSLGYVLLRCRQMGLDVGRDVSGESWLKPFANDMKREHDVLRHIRAALSADADADADADAKPTDGAQRIRAERQRQIAAEGYTPEHDRHHHPGVLIEAAECYLVAAQQSVQGHPVSSDPSRLPAYVRWPWEPEGWKPLGGPERNLEKAGALVAAALDRCVADAEPSRAEGDEQPQSLNELSDEWGLCRPPCTKPAGHEGACNAELWKCRWCGMWLPSCWWDVDCNHECAHRCVFTEGITREDYFAAVTDAEGGRPREANSESPLSESASEVKESGSGFHSEGESARSPSGVSSAADSTHAAHDDDGRSRAIDAILATLPDFFREDAEAAIDAALANGGVVPREWYAKAVAAYQAEAQRSEDAEARVRQLEAVLREIVDELPVNDPLGTLPVADSWVQAARAEQGRQQRRARAALEGGSDG